MCKLREIYMQSAVIFERKKSCLKMGEVAEDNHY